MFLRSRLLHPKRATPGVSVVRTPIGVRNDGAGGLRGGLRLMKWRRPLADGEGSEGRQDKDADEKTGGVS